MCAMLYTFVLFQLEYGGFGSVAGRIEIDIKINHEGEVNRLVVKLIVCICVYKHL